MASGTSRVPRGEDTANIHTEIAQAHYRNDLNIHIIDEHPSMDTKSNNDRSAAFNPLALSTQAHLFAMDGTKMVNSNKASQKAFIEYGNTEISPQKDHKLLGIRGTQDSIGGLIYDSDEQRESRNFFLNGKDDGRRDSLVNFTDRKGSTLVEERKLTDKFKSAKSLRFEAKFNNRDSFAPSTGDEAFFSQEFGNALISP